MSERENLQAQAEAMKEAAKAHGGANRKRIDEGLRRYLATEALHMSRETEVKAAEVKAAEDKEAEDTRKEATETEGTKMERGASREK